MKNLLVLFTLIFTIESKSFELGFHITEEGPPYSYASALSSEHPINVINDIHRLGGKIVIFNIRAHMIGPKSNEVKFANSDVENEIKGLKVLIQYAKSLNLKVGLRPIVLVLGPNKEFPYREGDQLWWHGNIRPTQPIQWFASFENFILQYLRSFNTNDIQMLTLGSELQSMTVGVGETENAFRIGNPELWPPLIRKIKNDHPMILISYDINFSETNVVLTESVGGEFERWRYGLTNLKNSKSSTLKKKHKSLVEFWSSLDFIGIDFYRYLARSKRNLSGDFSILSDQLTDMAQAHSTQIDNALFEIESSLNISKKIVIKEIGYKSSPYSFIEPADYSSPQAPVNLIHQAAAYKAIANSFVAPKWNWLYGIHVWDLSLTPNKSGLLDSGFSPVGKPLTEQVLLLDFKH